MDVGSVVEALNWHASPGSPRTREPTPCRSEVGKGDAFELFLRSVSRAVSSSLVVPLLVYFRMSSGALRQRRDWTRSAASSASPSLLRRCPRDPDDSTYLFDRVRSAYVLLPMSDAVHAVWMPQVGPVDEADPTVGDDGPTVYVDGDCHEEDGIGLWLPQASSPHR